MFIIGHTVSIPNPLLPEQRDEVVDSLKTRLETALQLQQVTLITNRELEKECNDLRSLVKEYESGLEAVASKLRTHAVKYPYYNILPNDYLEANKLFLLECSYRRTIKA